MEGKKKILILVWLGLFWLVMPTVQVKADWPMAGQNNQRTSLAPDTTPSTYNKGCGIHVFENYIPSKTNVITANLGSTSLVYISTAAGVYAIRATGINNSSADVVWFYPTSQPVGHSVTVDKATSTVYIPGLDKTIHAVNALTGAKKWQTLKAGGGFLTNPLVANNLVYAGNRDGYMYAFRTTDGSLAWYFKAGGSVDYSPAISTDNQVLYFAAHDNYAYAVNALTGAQVAKSGQFQGQGFFSFWPVVYATGNRVLFSRSLNYPNTNYIDSNQTEYLKAYTTPVDSTSVMLDWLNAHPDQQTLLVLDSASLQQRETAPYLWWGDPNGNRYPPAIDSTGRIWAMSPWYYSANVGFGRGRYVGWKLGETRFEARPSLDNGNYHESHDEPESIAIYANSIWHGDGGDGWDRGGVASLSSSTNKYWRPDSLYPLVGNWWANWPNFRYGNGLSVGTGGYPVHTGTHGLQNPPVPLNGRVYIHRSNALVCLEP